MSIVIGSIAGLIISFIIGVWATKKEIIRHEEVILNAENETENSFTELALPLEKKLRNAIYDCERNIVACKKEIQAMCKDQLDLIKDVGKVSHIKVKEKPLFFEYHNPVTNDRYYYYDRDLSKKIAPNVLENTKKIASKYTNHIELLLSQKELFEKLILSHKENLDRINGSQKQSSQIEKINLHKDKISERSQNNKMEEEAIYNELLITGISEELDHQEECLRQYTELNEKYENPFDEKVEEKYKLQIKEIIKQLEEEDPNHLHD
jgi:hypothetical protein